MCWTLVLKQKPEEEAQCQQRCLPKCRLLLCNNTQPHPPVHGIVDFSVHNHSFKHGAFTHHELDHSVDKREQIPTRKTQLKQRFRPVCPLTPKNLIFDLIYARWTRHLRGQRCSRRLHTLHLMPYHRNGCHMTGNNRNKSGKCRGTGHKLNCTTPLSRFRMN